MCQVLNVNPWDMPSNFCFYVYTQKWLFKVENVNAFFWTAACEFANHRAGSQLKMKILILNA